VRDVQPVAGVDGEQEPRFAIAAQQEVTQQQPEA